MSLPRNFKIDDSVLFYKKQNLHSLASESDIPLRVHTTELFSENFNFITSLAKQALTNLQLPEKLYQCGYAIKANQHYSIVTEAVTVVDFIEVSSENDLSIIETLSTEIGKKKIVCHGFKYPGSSYIKKIIALKQKGLRVVPVINSIDEFEYLKSSGISFEFGVRFESGYEHYGKQTIERFGISLHEFEQNISALLDDPKLTLSMLHMHIAGTMKVVADRLKEQNDLLQAYKLCKQHNHKISYLNFGGGLPDRGETEDSFYVDYLRKLFTFVTNTINQDEDFPIILNEPGRFLAAETQFLVLKVVSIKNNNEDFTWYVLDGSAINTVPEIFLDEQKYIQILPVNLIGQETIRVICSGTTCDPEDYFNKEPTDLPKISEGEDLYIVIPNTGAYQESLQGIVRGGVGHCLINQPTDAYFKSDDTISIIKNKNNFLADLGFPDK